MTSSLSLARLGLRFIGRSILHLAQNQKVWIVTVILALGQVSSLATDIAPGTLPTGGQITAGTGSIAQNGNLLVVQQDSTKLVANWSGFDIGSAAAVQFHQPGADSIALNRVTGGNPSQILGSLDANGRVFLLNPAGIVFGKTANVNVGGLVASTLSLSDAAFLAGRNTFTKSGPAGSIVNQGAVTAAPGGVVAFIAPVIRNEGTLAAPGGDVALAAGDQVDVDFAGDGRLRIRIDLSTVDTEVANHGLIKADGGAVVMSAKSAANLTRAVVNNTGIVEANTVSNVNGRIVIDTDLLSNTGTLDASGATGGSVAATAGYALNAGTISARGTSGAGGTILVAADRNVQTSSARFDASGATQGGKISLLAGTGEYNGLFSSATVDARGATGGTITLAGKRIDLRGATLDASGSTVGGSIRVGGELHGGAWTDPITGRALTNAVITDVSPGNTLKASATEGPGTGGRIIVWSDQQTYFYGAAQALGTGNGAGGFIEVSGRDRLQYDGTVDASSAGGKAGTVLFDPKNIVIDNSAGGSGLNYVALVNPNPGATGIDFGNNIMTLANGSMVVTDPRATVATVSGAGAAYLFLADGTLVSTLTGSHVNDNIGYDYTNYISGVTALTNGNYVLTSPGWDGTKGAVTWGSATTGVSGIVSSTNSLVGDQAGDQLGMASYGGTFALTNGNYVVVSPNWANGGTAAVGAATWVNGTNGHTANSTNTISAANSLIGSTLNDLVAINGVTVLANGNYAVLSPNWDNGGAANAGAVTWGNGTTGVAGSISIANSLVGLSANDQVGFSAGLSGTTALTNGNYVTSTPYWHVGADSIGAATWVNGSNGQTMNGVNSISSANSLVGSHDGDSIGMNNSDSIVALTNGNYVVSSRYWDNGLISGAGAISWGNGTTGTAGVISAANSLVGTKTDDDVGGGGAVALTNGNYVALSPYWNNGTAKVGAATWGDGTSGTLGAVTTANSVTGSAAQNRVGEGVTPLANGNYVLRTTQWNSGRGAATWVDGTNGHTSDGTYVISATNSLVGSTAGSWEGAYQSYMGGDHVGESIIALSNGNYVVASSSWNSGAGAVTWGIGATAGTRLVGVVSSANSLVGTVQGTYVLPSGYDAGDKVGSTVVALTNGNFVIGSNRWSNGGTTEVGAVTWVDGTTGITGTISIANSLLGSVAGDRISSGGIVKLDTGNYAVGSPEWNNGASAHVGAVTLLDGTAPAVGNVSTTNSLVGASAGLKIGYNPIAGSGDAFGLSEGVSYNGAGIYLVSTAPSYSGGYTFADNPADLATLTASQLTSVLNTGSNLVLQANNDITVTSAVTVNNASGNGGALTLQAGRSILLNNSITTDNGALTLVANETTAAGVVDAQRDAGAAVITTAGGTSINAGSGAVSITLKDGAGKTNTTSGDITLENIAAGSFTVTNSGPTAASDIIADGALVVPGTISVTTSGSFTQNAAATIGGGAGTITVTSDSIALNGGADSISGTGSIVFQPSTASRPMVLGAVGGVGDLALETAEIATLKDGFSQIQFGRSGAASGTGGITLSGPLPFYDPVSFYNTGVGGSITLATSAAVDTHGNSVALYSGIGDSGAFTQANGATLAAGAGAITIRADSIALNGAANSISGSNTIGIYPSTSTRPLIAGTAGTASDLALDAAEVATLTDGFGSIWLGGNAMTGGVTLSGPLTFHDNIYLQQDGGGSFTVNATPTVSGLFRSWGAAPVALNASVAATNGVSFDGAVTVGPGSLTVDAGTGTATFSSTVDHGTNAFTVTADDVALSGNWTGTGARILQPTTVSQTIGLAGAAGSFNLGVAELGYLSNDSPSSVTIGRSGGTGDILGSAVSFNDPLALRGGSIFQVAPWTLGSTVSFATGAANIALNTAGNDFVGAVTIVSGYDVNLRDTNALLFGGASTVSGTLNLTATSFTQDSTATITGGAGAINIMADTIALNGAVNSISGTGNLTLRPQTTSRPIVIGATGTASDFALDANELATLKNGFNEIAFGAGGHNGGITLSGALSFNDTVRMYHNGVGGAITLDNTAQVTTNGNPIFFYAGSGDAGRFTQANGATISAGSGDISIFADSIALNGAADSISGTADFRVYVQTGSRPIVLGAAGGAGDLAFSTAEIATLANGFSTIALGEWATTGGVTFSSGLTFQDTLRVYQTAGGQFTVTGTPTVSGSLTFSGAAPVALNASTFSTGVTFDGAVTVGAGSLTVDAGTGTATFSSTVAHGANSFTVTADDVAIASSWAGTGALLLQPTTVSRTIGLAGGFGSFALGATELGYLSIGSPSSVTIGRSGGTGAISGAAFSFDDPLLLRGGAITQLGDWTLSNTLSLQANFANGAFKNITLDRAGNDFGGAVTVVSGNQVSLRDANALTLGTSNVSGDLTLQTGGALSQTGDLAVTGTTSLTAGANDITFDRVGNDFGGAVSIVSGKVVALRDANALSLGAVTATGTVDIATLTGDLTLSGAVATTDTSADAIKLNAGRSAAAGTATGGNLIVSGGSVSTGAGGFATLYSGSISGSTGLTALVVSGSGRFRYNSDESATNYSTALTAGTNAIYREQPLLSVAPGSQAITYGDATPTFTATYGAYVNGDTSPGTVTGTATWTIGGTSSTAGYLVAGNHDVSYNNGLTGSSLGYGFADNAANLNELAIAQKSLTVTGLTAANRAYNATNVATLGGTATITKLGTDDVILGGPATGTFADKNFGTGKAVTVVGNTISGTDAANYTLVQQTGLTANISKANLVVTGLTAANKTYDATNTATLGGTAAITKLGSDDVTIGGTATGTFADKNFGTGKAVTVVGNTISGTDATNYTLVQQTGLTADISKATLAVTYTGVNRAYDTTTGATVTTSDDRLGSDVLTIIRTAAFTTKDAANGKTVNVTGVSLSGTDALNYSVATTGSTTANITPATLIVGYTGVNRIYDATTGATVSTSDNRLGSDVLTINRTAAFTTKDVANGKTVNVTGVSLSGTDALNYTVAATGSTTANITPATLTVGYTGVDRIYDATTGATVTTSDNRLGSDALTINRTAAFLTKDVANGKAVNVTGVSLTGADAINYTLAATTGSTTADITPATLTVGYAGVNRAYDATTGATVTTSDNRLGSDVLTINRTAAFTTKDVANGKTVNVTGVSLSGTDALNYTVAATGSTTANITPATLTVGYTGVNRIYDATTGATVTTSDNRLGSDALTINRTAAFVTKDVANGKTVNVTGVSITGADAGNYTLAATTGATTADITPATLTVTGLSVNNKVYDGTTSAVLGGSGTITALGSDVVTLDGAATAAFVDKNAGTGKAVAITGLTLTGADAANYTVASTGSAFADITAKALIATYSAGNKVYDGNTAATLTGSTLTGLVGTETLGATNTAAVFDNKDVGTGKTVTVAGIALTNGTNGGLASNYTVAATATTSAAITPATLTYVANPAEAFSAVSLPVLSGTVTGFVGGDTLATATTNTALWTSNVTTGSFTGNYAINGSGLLATNYVFVQAAGNATALFLQPVNPVVTDTPRVEPFIRIDGRNQGEIYPFEGGSLGLERSAVFAPLFVPAAEVIDRRSGEEAEDDETPAVTTTTAPAADESDNARSAQASIGSTPVAALLGRGHNRSRID